MHHLDRHFLGKPLGGDLVGPKHPLIRPSAILSTTSYFKLPSISNSVAINTISNRQTTVSGTANAKEQNIV
jgi:hypothetical protein